MNFKRKSDLNSPRLARALLTLSFYICANDASIWVLESKETALS